ncbi:MAG: cytochrome c nitrite reductase small subunit [Candidatus Riflebacteria bacterium]|nr:cytochrome c nitrite reductase small subunit [Candidatus Riflebacteria bacterium]
MATIILRFKGTLFLLAALAGVAGGVGVYAFVYARGYSYLSNDPKVCANCHVMQGHLEAWMNGSHRSVATCNDCHTPAGLVGKYVTKGLNGFWHSYAFTTGRFPDPIRITARNRAVTEGACLKCHDEMVSPFTAHATRDEPVSCLRCHSRVGHPR